MKKFFLILGTLFLLSGCSVNYEVNIDKEFISDNINVVGSNATDNNKILNYSEPVPAFEDSILPENPSVKDPSVEYFTETRSQDNLKYSFKHDDYIRNMIIRLSASTFDYNNTDGVIKINVENFIKAYYAYDNLENINIKVNVSNDYEILSSNATSQNENVLNWQVTKDNYQNSSISLELKEKENSTQSNSAKDENSNFKTYLTVFIGLLVFGVALVVIFVINNKLQNRDK